MKYTIITTILAAFLFSPASFAYAEPSGHDKNNKDKPAKVLKDNKKSNEVKK